MSSSCDPRPCGNLTDDGAGWRGYNTRHNRRNQQCYWSLYLYGCSRRQYLSALASLRCNHAGDFAGQSSDYGYECHRRRPADYHPRPTNNDTAGRDNRHNHPADCDCACYPNGGDYPTHAAAVCPADTGRSTTLYANVDTRNLWLSWGFILKS